MGLISYYSQPQGSNRIDTVRSPYAKAHTFTIEMTTGTMDLSNVIYYLNGKRTITGIIEEIPEISYSTTWGDSPVAVINDKIKKITQNKWIKMFSQQNDEYRPPLVTDAWTQQIPKAAEPLNVSFKFRAYPIEGYYNTTAFNDIIRLLIFITTPQSFKLSDTMDYMRVAGNEAYKKGNEAYDVFNDVNEAFNSENIDYSTLAATMNNSNRGIDSMLNTGDDKLYKAIDSLDNFITGIGDMKDNNVGGCPLIKLGINNLIKPDDSVKWLLKSWSFKPALQVTFENNPIYVDFNITLQTQYVLSNQDLDRILEI